MKRTHGLLVAGIAAFVVTLVVTLPAAVAIGWLAPAALRVSGVSGSVWRGNARELTLGGLRLSDTQWTLSVLDLLQGRLGAEIETRPGDGVLRGSMALYPSGGIHCTVCRYEGGAAALRPLIPSLRMLNGRLSLDLERLDIEDGWPARVIGVAKLADATFGNPGLGAAAGGLPSFKAEINADPVPDSGVIEVQISDAGGPLECKARVLMTPPGNYEFRGRVKAGPGSTAEFANTVSRLGPRATDGSTELSFSGSF